MEGIVKWFDAKKGYGFIISPGVAELTEADGNPRDVFAHFTSVQMEGFKKLEANEPVTYELAWSSDGKPQAKNVVRQSPERAPEQ